MFLDFKIRECFLVQELPFLLHLFIGVHLINSSSSGQARDKREKRKEMGSCQTINKWREIKMRNRNVINEFIIFCCCRMRLAIDLVHFVREYKSKEEILLYFNWKELALHVLSNLFSKENNFSGSHSRVCLLIP